MNQRANQPPPAGARWAGLRLVLALFPGVAITAPSAASRPSRDTGTRAYLAITGAPSLRFSEPVPPPDLTGRPAAGAPPQPHLEIVVADTPQPIPELPLPDLAPTVLDTSVPSKTATATQVVTEKTLAPIIPDETRPRVRAEDFLPFFIFPGTSNLSSDVTVIVPAAPTAPTPGTIPPSSASYRQL